jgi:hypothetical protein
LLLVPQFGVVGAAWVNASAYFVLASVAFALSQRVYPYALEWGRMARLALAATGAWLLAMQLPDSLSPLVGLIARGLVVCAAYPVLLLALGFYDGRELRTVGRIAARLRARRTNTPETPAALDGPVEAGGAILEVPLVQDDLRENEIVKPDETERPPRRKGEEPAR